MPPQSAVTTPSPQRVQALQRPVDLSTLSDLDVISVLPTMPGWRTWFTSAPHLVTDQMQPNAAAYVKAIGDLARFVNAVLRPGSAVTLTITSPLASDGRSTVAANLALTCAEMGKKVLLIDGDMHGRALGGLFNSSVRPLGLSNVLTGAVYWRDLVSAHSTHPNLQFLAAGSAEVGKDLPAGELAFMIEEAKPFYDLILFDSAPLLQHPHTIDLVVASDAILLLVRRSHTRHSELVSTLGYLRRVDAPVLAIALNDA